jgi:integrase
MERSEIIDRLQASDIEQLAKLLGDRLYPGESITEISFEDFATLYIERYAKVHKKTWRQDLRRIRHHLLPVFSGRQLSSIKRVELQELHTRIGEHGRYAANRAIENLAKMFNLAKLWGYYPSEKQIPTFGITAFKEKPREVFIKKDDMLKVAASIDLVKVYHLRVLFWCYLLTAMRECELIKAKWEDLDTGRSEIIIRDTKNGTNLTAPLSPEALELILSLPRKSVYIFAGPNPDKPLNPSTVFRSWDRVRKRAGIGNVTVHDLRRTAASWLAQSGCSLPLIGKVLNQKSSRATEIYARFAQDDVREILQKHGNEVRAFMPSMLEPISHETFRITPKAGDRWKLELLLTRLENNDALSDEAIFLRCLIGGVKSEEASEVARIVDDWRSAVSRSLVRPRKVVVSGHAPFGWHFVSGLLVENEVEQETRSMIFRWFDEYRVADPNARVGTFFRRIAKRLDEHGIRAKRGGTWNSSSVQSVLERREQTEVK